MKGTVLSRQIMQGLHRNNAAEWVIWGALLPVYWMARAWLAVTGAIRTIRLYGNRGR